MASSATLRSSTPSSLCKRCSIPLAAQRSFSSRSRLLVGPESPRYIDVPEPPQLPRKRLAPVKGTLPLPRDVFAKETLDKTSEEYLAAVTKEPIATPSSRDVESPRVQYRTRMAEMRRNNLRSGLAELKERSTKTKARAVAQARANSAVRHRLLNAPEKRDEQLTGSTITQEIYDLLEKRPTLRTLPTEANFTNVSRLQQRESNERQAAIHTLYTHARDFILTEEQLDKTVEDAFGTDEDPVMWSSTSTGRASGPWDRPKVSLSALDPTLLSMQSRKRRCKHG